MATIEAMAANASSGQTTVSVRGVKHVYPGGKLALDDVNLEIGVGLFGLLGPNGAGKSTLMRIMCTLLTPTGGEASVLGHDTVKDRQAVRTALGYLPQEFGAWRLQKVREVVDTLAGLSGIRDKAARKQRVEAVIEQVGLQEVTHRKVKKLSGGMLRRLGVAQALVHDPPVIIVDEPTVGLDPQERLRFRRLMADLARDRTIILSTHIVADLGSSCRDLALIDTGKIVFRGSPQGLLQHAGQHVFEMVADRAQEARLVSEGVEIVSRTADGEGSHIRAVAADGSIPPGAKPVSEPTLEEGYLGFMASRGRAEVARTEEETS
ncbi:MAG: ATP-binding cassette domain-containing protein [Acidobacteriota bacterium]|nr:ATP-binding cassette domain-containing protein [Acidobacteriota bacterium]MDH3784132.1 ATP-binding cassette domain-containing protein [Acidobacteriota bacterium]